MQARVAAAGLAGLDSLGQLVDLEELATDPGYDEFDDAYVLDSDHVLVTGKLNPQGRTPEICHWLFQAATLRPLGRLHYPAPVSEDVAPRRRHLAHPPRRATPSLGARLTGVWARGGCGGGAPQQHCQVNIARSKRRSARSSGRMSQ
ncbi:hypothetical protein Sgleb_71620 [Streptomyces glebosus]|uniref:Uncharacterized protein n=1 Tax=Streptomyces glebosus TaxID=249580 RepID=A0A640TBS8_9ACTN|nr:hypothetical protein Sgleb_71620 [Streptomyces glebosus]GHG77528.1 hypothetical protein GCM10010513_53290 [Streptomyces glebosus]